MFAAPAKIPSDTLQRGTPYQDSHQSGAQTIPGKVECAYYDRGGEGVAYHDTDAMNSGSGGLNPADGTYLNQFRMDEGVDISYHAKVTTTQIDNSPYNLVQPPENQLYVGVRPRPGRMVQHHSADHSRGLPTTRPIFSTLQIAVEPFRWT